MSEPLAILIPLTAPEGESETEFYHRKFSESVRAICLIREENDKLQAENDKLRWMLDTIMHEHRRRMEIRGGYAKIYEVVMEDLEADYEARDEENDDD